MGRCDYHAVGHGFTEQEAYRDAVQSDRTMNGHQEGYSGSIGSSTHEDDHSKCIKKPVVSKRATVEKKPFIGTRKWETTFVITGDRTGRTAKTQGEAIKIAKELAIQKQETITIDIEKRLVNGSSRIAVVSPKKSIIGEWKFWGVARE
jgi:hypothetical protein